MKPPVGALQHFARHLVVTRTQPKTDPFNDKQNQRGRSVSGAKENCDVV